MLLQMRNMNRLKDWVFRIEELDHGEYDSQAYVTMDREKKVATFHVWLEAERLPSLLAHEVAHVMLADLSFFACQGATIKEMELWSLMEERLCNQIGALIEYADASV